MRNIFELALNRATCCAETLIPFCNNTEVTAYSGSRSKKMDAGQRIGSAFGA